MEEQEDIFSKNYVLKECYDALKYAARDEIKNAVVDTKISFNEGSAIGIYTIYCYESGKERSEGFNFNVTAVNMVDAEDINFISDAFNKAILCVIWRLSNKKKIIF